MALTGDRLTRILNTYDTALQGAEDATLARIYAALDAAGKLLEQKLIKSYAKNQGVQGLLPNDRALLIRQEIAEYMALLKPEQREAIEADFERLLSTASQTGLNLSQELINATTNTNVAPFAVLNLEAVRFQAQDAAKRLYRWTDEYQQKISGIVEMHLAVGSGPQKVAATLRSELGIAKGRAEMIARTESISAMDSATRENYKRNEISYVQRIATQDARTCGYCAARAGKVYRLEEAPSALHPRDRCFNSPWKPEWAALGLVDNAWAEKHVADVQSQVQQRGEALNDGPAPFERMNGLQPPKPVWSPGEPLPKLSGQKQPPTSLESLMRTGRDRIAKLGPNPTLADIQTLRGQLLKGLPKEQAEDLANEASATDKAIDVIGEDALVGYLSEIQQLTGGQLRPDITFFSAGDRPYADSDQRAVNIGTNPSRYDIFHELGHFLEFDNPELAEASRQWRAAKATGEARSLRDITGKDDYEFEEVALPGKFVSPYVGKTYDNGFTEVVAVGMEMFAAPESMLELLQADPDHFAYMIGILDAAQQKQLSNAGSTSTGQGQPLYQDKNWYNKFLRRTDEEIKALEAKRRAEFEDYLKREEESIRRRTSGEIDRKLREYYDSEARQIRQKLGIPEPDGAIASESSETPDDLQIKSYNRNLKPVPVPGLDVDEASLSDSGKAALKVARDYQQVLSEINEAIAKIPGPDKTLPADAYQRIYSNINGLFDRVTGLVNESKALAGKTGNEALDAQLARMSKISKEALPGYEIKPITPELETKAAKRPC